MYQAPEFRVNTLEAVAVLQQDAYRLLQYWCVYRVDRCVTIEENQDLPFVEINVQSM
jgi:hypothetical protein